MKKSIVVAVLLAIAAGIGFWNYRLISPGGAEKAQGGGKGVTLKYDGNVDGFAKEMERLTGTKYSVEVVVASRSVHLDVREKTPFQVQRAVSRQAGVVFRPAPGNAGFLVEALSAN